MAFIKHVPPPKPLCTASEHWPPSHIVLEPGAHTWECPECGKQTVITVPKAEL